MNKILILSVLLFFILTIYLISNKVSKEDTYTHFSIFDSDNRWKVYSNIPADGSCFYHSVLFLISKKYRDSNASEQYIMAHDLRKSLRSYCSYDNWHRLYRHVCSYELLCHNILFEWAGNIEWKILSDFLNIQIIIFRDFDSSLYWGYEGGVIDPNKKVIFILNRNDNHFEPVVYQKPDRLQYVFKMSNSIHSLLNKKIKCKN